jgi:hypothetical protein
MVKAPSDKWKDKIKYLRIDKKMAETIIPVNLYLTSGFYLNSPIIKAHKLGTGLSLPANCMNAFS